MPKSHQAFGIASKISFYKTYAWSLSLTRFMSRISKDWCLGCTHQYRMEDAEILGHTKPELTKFSFGHNAHVFVHCMSFVCPVCGHVSVGNGHRDFIVTLSAYAMIQEGYRTRTMFREAQECMSMQTADYIRALGITPQLYNAYYRKGNVIPDKVWARVLDALHIHVSCMLMLEKPKLKKKAKR